MEELRLAAEQFNLHLTHEHIEQFELLYNELLAWNEHQNLTSITLRSEVLHKHFLDSLSVVQALDPKTTSLIDIGSGAGFPGLPIKIVRPDIQVTLLESVAKKVTFLEHAINKLGLTNIQAIVGRAETLGQTPEYREHYDAAVARAVAKLPDACRIRFAFSSCRRNFYCSENSK
jgi:16S rRNA (guanine527-N7)-methyltransferase